MLGDKKTNLSDDFSLILASSVHDMKNSVGMLLASLEEFISESSGYNLDQKRQLSVLQYESSRISSELIQLLSIYRMQGDRLPVNLDKHYVIDMLSEQVARNDMLFHTQNITVDIDCSDDCYWYYDESLVAGVIHNVLVNCARYTRSKIDISVQVQDDYIEIKVSDDGSGFPAAMLSEPEKFCKPINFTTGSTDLGLFFAYKVASLHQKKSLKGYISLENGGPLGGGRFSLFLP
ncbi:sensor histidine kinase [Aurantivibrio infirmus]